MDLALYKNGKGSGRIPKGGLAAAIGRAQPVAPDAIDTEDGRPGTSLADLLFLNADLQQGKVCHGVGQPRYAMVVGGNVVMPHFQMKISLVIAGEQAQMSMNNWMAVRGVENANGDGVVVNHRKVLIGATHLSGANEQWRAEIKSKRKDGKLRSEGPNGALKN